MNVVYAALQIVLVANYVLPIALVPYSTVAMARPRLGLWQFSTTSLEPFLAEFFLDPHPAERIAIIASRKCPDAVPMFG